MSLARCKDCGNEVSTDAKACPRCGSRMPKKTGFLTQLIAVLIALGVLGAIFGGTNSTNLENPQKPRPAKTQVQLDEDARFDLAFSTHKAIKKELKDPDSLVVEKIFVNEKVTVACMQYRAKNSFGGYNRETVVVVQGAVNRGAPELVARHCKAATFDLTSIGK
jgi:hypothetical protein